MNKVMSVKDAASLIKNGASVMITGFLKAGSPTKIIDELVANQAKDLTLIANDTSYLGFNRGKLIENKCIKKAIVAHIGTNPETSKQMNDGSLEVELNPLGTLVERIHAGGAGLGGFYTPTGVGTLVEEGKETKIINGKKYILETPLTADFAILYGTKVDKYGNVYIHGTAKTHNLNMATAAKTVIVEADEIIDGHLDPNMVTVPNIFVNYIVKD